MKKTNASEEDIPAEFFPNVQQRVVTPVKVDAHWRKISARLGFDSKLDLPAEDQARQAEGEN